MDIPSVRRFSHVAWILSLAIVYLLAGKLSLDLAVVHPQASAVWPPTGIALAALLLRGYGLWPGVLLGAFLVNLTAGDPGPARTLAAVGIAIGNTLEALLGAYLVRRFVSASDPFDRAPRVFAFIGAVAASTTVSATCGIASLSLSGLAEWDAAIWRHWWIGDMTGAIAFAPLIILVARDHSWRWGRRRLLEAGALVIVAFALSLAAFTRVLTPQPHLGLAFLTIPPLLWAAFRFGQREVAITMLPISVIGIWGVLSQGLTAGGLPTERVLLEFQIYMGVMSAMFLAVAADITGRKRADQALRESQERLRLALDAGQMGAWEWSMETNQVIWSPGLEAIHGLQAGTFPGTYEAYWSDVHPEDRDKVEESIRYTLESGEDHHIEYRIVWPDDSVHFVEARGKLVRDKTGSPVRMIGVCAEVTARKQAEEALRESEERFRTLADSSPVLIWVNGLEGCEFVNRAYLDYLRLKPAEVKGFVWAEFLHPEDRDGCVNEYLTAFANRETFTAQFRFRRFDGEYRWMKALGLPRFSGSGEFLGYVGCVLDITDIKEAEERLREDDRQKDEFIAILAHELRNPLAALCLGLEVMKGLEADPARLGQIRTMMERQSRQIVAMVDDLLEVSRITRGKLELRKTRATLADIIESAIETARPAIDEKRHQLSVELPHEKLETYGDPQRLSQILSNLLGNAAKFMADGGKIRLMLERQGDEALFSVQDSGIGIPASMQDKIFDMFVQIEHPLDRGGAGLGVGLALAKTLTEMHGGTIGVRSEGAGQGSEFHVRLPLVAGTADEPASAVESHADPAGRVARRVLIVDDNEDASQILQMLIETLGNQVRTAADGAEAIEIAPDFLPEIVFLDLGMPRMNGYDAARHIRRQSYGKDTMLVALTGWGQEEDRQRIRQAGFDHHLVKPANLEQLRELLTGLKQRTPG